jgi:HD-GYP domain-containing protein (c-di-GMP phosphodiesterase class II)
MTAIRLADLLAGLSRLADLGFGLQAGHALRSAALTAGLSRDLGLTDEQRRAALYTALLLHVGCIGYAHEQARAFGDDLAAFAAVSRTNVADARDVVSTFLPEVTRGHPLFLRVRLGATTFVRGKHHGQAASTAACEVGRDAARRLGLPDEVQHSVYSAYEWWDGGGEPLGRSGDEIPVGARLAVLAAVAMIFDDSAGPEAAVHAVRQQRGTILDPDFADRFLPQAHDLLAEVRGSDPRTLLLEAEPSPVISVLEPRLAEVARVFGDIADVKSPFTHGHSRGVAVLAREGASRLGLTGRGLDRLEIAALLHDVGRVAVSNAIWDKAGPLTDDEWEQVRLHAYHSERILAGSQRLRDLAALVGRHHERLDGSGYHRGATESDLSVEARVLAAADVYQAMTQQRPHRPALPAEHAAEELLTEARAGYLDADAVAAVLEAAGHEHPTPEREPPAGLTARELEVLRLVAIGESNKQIARRLDISRRTAETHVSNLYTKIGVSSRAAAALFAMEHGLLAGRAGAT